jgi:D-glycero-alpha-D-manno-heptose 1-phosphate guanylyltransferase
MLRTAIILAGGLGTRLKQAIKNVPKPMAPVKGKPFLEYLLKQLHRHEIREVIISTGYLHEKVSAHFGDEFMGMKLRYATETQPLGTGGGLRLAMSQTAAPAVLVLNGDSYFDINLKQLYNLHVKHHSDVSIALCEMADASRYGRVRTDALQRITSFDEKNETDSEGLINAGIYIFNRQIFLRHAPEDSAFSLETDFFAKKAGNILMSGFSFEGKFIDIGIPEDYQRAQHELQGFAN